MAQALLRIQVAGLGDVGDDEARNDGVSGSLMTLTSVGVGNTTHTLRLISTTDPSPPTLNQTMATVWEFTPNNGPHSYLFELECGDGTNTDFSRRTYRIASTELGLLYPTPMETCDPTAGLNNNGPAIVAASNDNAGGNYFGWADRAEPWLRQVESYARGYDGLPAADAAAWRLRQGGTDYLNMNTAAGAVEIGVDLVVAGDLTVQGNVFTVDVANVTVEDPLMLLASGQVGAGAFDSGLITERGTDPNVGLIWDESADEFAAIQTTDDGTTAGNVAITDYLNMHVGTLVADDSVLIGGAAAATSLQTAYAGGGDIQIASSNPVDITHAAASTTNYFAQRFLWPSTPYTGLPRGLLLDASTATSVTNDGTFYGVEVRGIPNSGNGDSVGVGIDAGWDAALVVGTSQVATSNVETRYVGGDGTDQARFRVSTDFAASSYFDVDFETDTMGDGIFDPNQTFVRLGYQNGVTTQRFTRLYMYGANGAGPYSSWLTKSINGTLSLEHSSGSHSFQIVNGIFDYNAGNFDIDSTGDVTFDMDANHVVTFTVADDQTAALVIREGSNNYIAVNTENTGASVVIGNGTTDPAIAFVGDGTFDVDSAVCTLNANAVSGTTNNAYVRLKDGDGAELIDFFLRTNPGANPDGTLHYYAALDGTTDGRSDRGSGIIVGGGTSLTNTWSATTVDADAALTFQAHENGRPVDATWSASIVLDAGTNDLIFYIPTETGIGGSGATGSFIFDIPDNATVPFVIADGANGYFLVSSSNNNEHVTIGPGHVDTSQIRLNQGANGQRLDFRFATENHTLASSGFSDTTITLPVDALILYVQVRVTTAVTTSSATNTFDVGISGDTTRYGTGISGALDTINNGADSSGNPRYGAGNAVRLSAPGAETFTAGVVRVTIQYAIPQVATS